MPIKKLPGMRLASSFPFFGLGLLTTGLILAFGTRTVSSAALGNILHQAATFVTRLFSAEKLKGPQWQEEVSREIERYVREVKMVHELLERNRRSTPLQEDRLSSITRDEAGIYIFTGVEKKLSTEAQFPSDINVFSIANNDKVKTWYAVALESHGKHITEDQLANLMVIYEYHNATFTPVLQIPVQGGVDINTFEIEGSTYIAVAEHSAGSKPLEGSVIYKVLIRDSFMLEHVQTLNTKHPRDITVWKYMNKIFMAVAQGSGSNTSAKAGESLVYQWLGKHFDLICIIPTNDAQKVTHFNIGSSMYLAVANHKDTMGNPAVDSEIFKFNLNEEKFLSYQKFKTYGAMDVEIFSFQNQRKIENFMIIANMYKYDAGENVDYKTNSVIYKWVDKFFIPFQSIKLHAVTDWEPVMGDHGEFVLLAASKGFGVKAFQYDGWKFVESDIVNTQGSMGEGVSKIRSVKLDNDNYVLVTNKKNDGTKPDVFQLKFRLENSLDTFHVSLENWCRHSLIAVEQRQKTPIVADLENAPKIDSPLVELVEGSTSFLSLSTRELITERLYTSNGSLDENTLTALKNMHNVVNSMFTNLDNINSAIQRSMKINGNNFVRGSITFNSVTLACIGNCSVSEVQIETLNGEQLVNLTRASQEKRFNIMKLENLTVKGTLFSHKLNGDPVEHLVDKSKDIHLKETLTVHGHLVLDEGANVQGKEEELVPQLSKFHNETVSLNTFPSEASKMATVQALKSRAATEEKLNKNNFASVTANNVQLKGLISGINFEGFQHKTLKSSGNLIISEYLSFEKLVLERYCTMKGLVSGVEISNDIVMIHEGVYSIPGVLNFTSPLVASQVLVHKYLNDVPVSREGQLRILLQDFQHPQTVKGVKTVENLHITGQCSMNGTVNGQKREEYEQMLVIDENIIIHGDVDLLGNITVDGTFEAGDVLDYQSQRTLNELASQGLHLEEEKISVPVTISTSQYVKQLDVEAINEMHPENWIQSKNELTQVKGKKTFAGILHLSTPIDVTGFINGNNIKQLDGEILKVSGDQVISGSKMFGQVSAPKCSADEFSIGQVNWRDMVLENGNQTITGTKTFIGPLTILHSLDTNDLQVRGSISGINLDALYDDSLYHNGDFFTIEGTKVFEGQLSISNITATHDQHIMLALKEAVNTIDEQVNYLGDLKIKSSINVKSFHCSGQVDGMDHEMLGSAWLLSEGQQTLHGIQTFHSVDAYAGVKTASGFVNDVFLAGLARKAIYINENASLEFASFDNEINVQGNLALDGKLQGLDVKNDLIHQDKGITIMGTKTFQGPVSIADLTMQMRLANLNLDRMCQFIFHDNPGTLRVKGFVATQYEPNVKETINGFNVQGLKDYIWYSDQNVVLAQYFEFSHMMFEGLTEVKGSLNSMDLQWLSENYFSKSKDQTVPSPMYFDHSVTFEKNLKANEAFVGGLAGPLKLESFSKRVLIDGSDQDIVETLLFNEVISKGDFELKGSVNGLNLATDVMLLSRNINVVTGKTIIHEVNCQDVYLNEGASLQGVDVPLWMKQSVRTNGNFTVKGQKSFTNSKFMGQFDVEHLVNGIPFTTNNVMVQGYDQSVTGQKTFVQGNEVKTNEAVLYIDYLNMGGLINDISFVKFVPRVAFKDGSIFFTTFKTLTGLISTNYCYINGWYQGVNVSALAAKHITPENLQDEEATLYQLLESARIAEVSLSLQAVYLSHYKVLQTFQNRVDTMVPIYSNDSRLLLAVMYPSTEKQVNVRLLEWDEKAEIFLENKDLKLQKIQKPLYINEEQNLHYTTTFTLEEYTSLIPEYFNSKDHYFDLKHIPGLQPNMTLLSVTLPDPEQHCILVLGGSEVTSKFYCMQLEGKKILAPHQELPHNAIKATSLRIDGVPHLMVVHGATDTQESSVSVWRLLQRKFELQQVMDTVNALAISSASYANQHFIAVASGLLWQAAHPGIVYILRYEGKSGTFLPWVEVLVPSPTAIQFSELPSGELALYVLSNDQAKPLSVFLYHGMEGFHEKTHATTIVTCTSLNVFRHKKKHFVALAGENEGIILQGIFKGVL